MAGFNLDNEGLFDSVSRSAQRSMFLDGGGGSGGALNAARRRMAQQKVHATQLAQPSAGAASAAKVGDWVLAAAPSHKGYGGLTPATQEWVRRLMGAFPELRFTSGYRDPRHNARVGGVKNSGHTRGVKADFVGTAEQMRAAAEWVRRYGGRPLTHDAGSGMHLDASFEGLGL